MKTLRYAALYNVKIVFLSGVMMLFLQVDMGMARAGQSDLVAVIEVSSQERDYRNAIAMVDIPGNIMTWRPLQLIDMETGRSVPVQVENGDDNNSARLWFVIDEEIPAQATRRYELYYGNPVNTRKISLALDDTGVRFLRGGNVMFQYNHSHVKPPVDIDPKFIRSGYIHPVYSPSGLLVTEDFPDDHLHHKGVWFPWTRTQFEGRDIDFWNLGKGEGTVQFAGFENMHIGPVFSGFRARHEFVDLTQPHGGKVALNEYWDVRVWNSDDAYYLWDLTSTQWTATDSPLKLLEHRYGGLGFRGAAQWDGDNHVILTSEGHTKEDGHTQRSRWIAHSGEILGGEWATVMILAHPDNKRSPESMRIWESNRPPSRPTGAFFNYTPVQLGDWTLEPGNAYQFRYRFLIYDGKIDAELAEQMWQQFAYPIKAEIQVK
jgi:hypothetical protein